jgi:hypothetical protein
MSRLPFENNVILVKAFRALEKANQGTPMWTNGPSRATLTRVPSKCACQVVVKRPKTIAGLSETPVRVLLSEAGLSFWLPMSRIALKPHHIAIRLQAAQKWRNQPVDFWKN